MRIVSAAAAVALLVPGCRPTDSDRATRISIRDSAGIRIVEHAGDPAAGLEPTALGDPVYTHGGGSGHYLFERVFAGRLLPGGEVAIVDAGASEIVLIAADGSGHRVLAGSGEGPSQVRGPMSVHSLDGRGILVEDDGNQRLLEFAGDTLTRTTSLAGDLQLTQGLLAHALDGSGRLLMTTSSFRSDAGEGWIPGAMVRLDPETRAADTLATYDMAISRPRDQPFDPFAPFGHASASPASFVYGRSDRGELAWRDPAGRVTQIVRWRPERTVPTERHLEVYVEWHREALARSNPDMPSDALDAFIERRTLRTVPDRPMPLYSDVMDHGPEGVWLRDYWLSDPAAEVVAEFSTAYTVVSSDGETFRRVTLPRPAKVLDVADGRVLAVVQDDLAVQHVVVYALPAP